MMWLGIDNNGWVRETSASRSNINTDLFEAVEHDETEGIYPADPSKNETAWNWKGGNPEKQDTGNSIPPEPDEAKGLLLKQLKQWGWNRGKIRSLIKKYAVYEFVDGDNFEEAKLEIDDAESSNDITASEAQALKDILDGKT